ncbi:MAG: hypothetical protein QF613_02710 [Candidatus Marinimicrobia bacterium]|jgi:tetratricopeptide (TPR) repeat protein|nr:hypothetical protein [Candidatus Neomarinimicrobiota bacterium]MDP6456586.1 hypothetical protein [Candidatus Neomarinimicrobiota bacterium]MDP6593104.1 hypothetical protein [Candidatus Neomarinimicrobiota bacterium]MDP6836803.1 hypothetical protein [Candidatus Neomarinimicrobiota bacterium]|tara:strand:+ start:20789 stop:22705 length:1917 start_codon:yes stop_codon:yes gene_type:complete
MRYSNVKRIVLLLSLGLLCQPLAVYGQEEKEKEEKTSRIKGFAQKIKLNLVKFKLSSPREIYSAVKDGDNPAFEAVFRPLEFREPIMTIPAEGRYGVGFYGWKGLNPLAIGPKTISYETDTLSTLSSIGFTGRMGTFLEFDAVQTNLSYALFKKSYVDFLTGFGLRYSSILPLPRMELTDAILITGAPEVPTSWGVEKTFSPSALEANVVSSFILQWRPKWFIHLKYSYGLNYMRFYKDDVMNSTPYGLGRSSAYSVGLKIIRETAREARYAWGIEFRHVFHNVSTIKDPDNVTPISAMQLPNLGLYFTFSAFYGGRTTVGDVGKKLFLNRDYVAAKPKLVQFINTYPDHARADRAKKLLALTNKRIPQQLYAEGLNLEDRTKMDEAVTKYLDATRTADEELGKTLAIELENMAKYYIQAADSLVKEGKNDEAIQMARKAAAISEWGKDAQRKLVGKIYLVQGNSLALSGLYHMALAKYVEALKLNPGLKDKVRKAELEAAVGMVEDVNTAHDEASLRVALESLRQVKEILREPDYRFDEVVMKLEKQLRAVEDGRVRKLMVDSMHEARQEIIRRHEPRVTEGMLVSEVQDILGDPHEVVQREGVKDQNYQMWIYYLADKKKKLLYFENYVLYKIEEG